MVAAAAAGEGGGAVCAARRVMGGRPAGAAAVAAPEEEGGGFPVGNEGSLGAAATPPARPAAVKLAMATSGEQGRGGSRRTSRSAPTKHKHEDPTVQGMGKIDAR